jgi:hypothetical protein
MVKAKPRAAWVDVTDTQIDSKISDAKRLLQTLAAGKSSGTFKMQGMNLTEVRSTDVLLTGFRPLCSTKGASILSCSYMKCEYAAFFAVRYLRDALGTTCSWSKLAFKEGASWFCRFRPSYIMGNPFQKMQGIRRGGR